MKKSSEFNREGWLTALAKQIEPVFHGFKLAPYRLTCGWPSQNAMSRKARRVGECHALEVSSGGVHEIFISPVLDKSIEVAGTVCHEMAHVAAGIKASHGRGFVIVCRHVGLTKGKPRSVMPGERLEEKLLRIVEAQGIYPHKAIVPSKALKAPRSPSTETLECECGCRVTISKKWLEEAGYPTCGCGLVFGGGEE